ncbi:hypothetical protein [Arthrobacter sp. VKM Ac-2550]|uniref:hypothetical protein n=1 Tax=Crystallibacter permensis TaxID=1938888 RepID=UPI002226D52C|nr:hypothetical protein [Arthrobacter sp. VKM Ac-2550]
MTSTSPKNETGNTGVINRVIQNRTVSIEVIEAIRGNALILEGKVWLSSSNTPTGSWPPPADPRE